MTTISEQQQSNIQQAEAKLSDYRQRVATETDPDRRDKWIEYVNAWEQGVKHAKAGYTFSSVSDWATATAAGHVAHAMAKEEAEKAIVKVTGTGMTGIEKFQYETFRKAGYSSLEASKLTAWSMKHQMTPGPKTAKQIVKGQDVSPYARTTSSTKISPFGLSYLEKPDPKLIPSQIGLPTTREEDWKSPRVSVWTGIKGAGSAIVYDVKQLLTGKPIKEWRDPAEPFRLTAPTKWEKTAYFKPQFGTTIEAFKPITYGSIQKETEFKRTLAVGEERYKAETELGSYFAGLQKKIDVGEKSFEKATALGKIKESEFQKEFQSKVESIYKKYPDVKGVGERTSPIYTGAKVIRDITVYSTPLTATMALGMETQKAPLIIKGNGIPTYISFKPTTSMYVSGGIVGLHAAGLFARTAKGMTLGRIESAMESVPIKVSGERYFLKGGEKVLDVGKWKAYGDYSVAKGTTLSVSEMTGKKVLTKGISDVEVMTKTYWSGKPLVVGGRKAFEIESKILPKTSSVYPSISKMTSYPMWEYSLIGKGKDFLKGAKFKGKAYTSAPTEETLLGGTSQRGGGYVFGRSGKISQATYDYIQGKGFKVPKKVEFKFGDDTWTIMKEVKPKIEKDVFKKTISGKLKTPLSKTFTEQKAFAPTQLKQITKEVYTPTISSPTTIIKQIKTQVSGITTKQLTRTIPITTTALASVSKQAYIQKPSSSLMPKTSLKYSTGLKEALISGSALRSAQLQAQAQITRPTIISTSPALAPTFKTPLPKLGIPFLLPPIGARLGTGIKIKTTQLGKQPTKYQPSYTALVLGIKAPKIPKAYKVGAGGLIIRPIITKKKSRRRKKK